MSICAVFHVEQNPACLARYAISESMMTVCVPGHSIVHRFRQPPDLIDNDSHYL